MVFETAHTELMTELVIKLQVANFETAARLVLVSKYSLTAMVAS